MAGDTASAQAVAAHLAGCPSCTAELVRLERAAPIIRDAVRELMPADLRERTLAAVRAEGRPRGAVLTPALAGAAAGMPMMADTEAATATATATSAAPTPIRATTASTTRRQVLGWMGAIAAAVVLSVVTTSIIVGSRVDGQLATQAETISALEEVTTQTLAVTSEPDAQHVALTGTTDPGLAGSLAFSPTTAELVVVANGLTEPAAGQEYRCWVEVDGTRHRIGKMFFSSDLAYWVGPAPAVAGLSGSAHFGVSLVAADGTSVDSPPVLVGGL
jgi:hypothetical protein